MMELTIGIFPFLETHLLTLNSFVQYDGQAL